MKSGAESSMPAVVRRALAKLGDDVNIARRKRNMSVDRTTQGAGISPGTLPRLERGDPSVSLGAFAMVLLTLGEHKRLESLLDMAKDTSGLLLDMDRLPKRIVAKSVESARAVTSGIYDVHKGALPQRVGIRRFEATKTETDKDIGRLLGNGTSLGGRPPNATSSWRTARWRLRSSRAETTPMP